MVEISVIVVAGGEGLRMGGKLPKQFFLLNNKPLLAYTLDAIASVLPEAEIILSLHPSYIDYWHKQCALYGITTPHSVVAGGKERFYSVKNGIAALSVESKYILIHDGVRPFVSSDVILGVLSALKNHSAVIPVVKMTNSLRMIQGEGSVAVDRGKYLAVQTPQGFCRESLVDAYNQPYNPIFTDDASVVESNGCLIHLSEGCPRNIKITTTEDIYYANYLLHNSDY